MLPATCHAYPDTHRRRTLDGKLKTLDGLYQLLKHDPTIRWMMILEATIGLLFVIDLVILVLGLKGQ